MNRRRFLLVYLLRNKREKRSRGDTEYLYILLTKHFLLHFQKTFDLRYQFIFYYIFLYDSNRRFIYKLEKQVAKRLPSMFWIASFTQHICITFEWINVLHPAAWEIRQEKVHCSLCNSVNTITASCFQAANGQQWKRKEAVTSSCLWTSNSSVTQFIR